MNTLRIMLLSIILIVSSVELSSQNIVLTKYNVSNSGFMANTAGNNFIQGNFGQSIVGFVDSDGDDLYIGYWDPVDLVQELSVESGIAHDKKIQNYPNPFRDYTDIRFELDGAANVKLKIYDMNGSVVNEVFNGYLGAGTHSITWNGFRSDGQLASNATYLYELSVEPFAGSTAYSKNYTLRNTMILAR